MGLTKPPVRVLVTGFGPFPGVPHNASGVVAEALEGAAIAPGVRVFSGVLPVIWSDARREVLRLIAGCEPHAVLHFGVAKRAARFEIEGRAYNMSGPKQDQAGAVRPAKPLIPSGRRLLYSTLPPLALVQALNRKGYPAAISKDAGRYLCNAVLYWSLTQSRGGLQPLTGFIHIPAFGLPAEAEPRLTLEDTIAGARILVRAAVRAVLESRLPGSLCAARGAALVQPPRRVFRSSAASTLTPPPVPAS